MTPPSTRPKNSSEDGYGRLSGRRLLVVEDDPFIACEIEHALEGHSANVVGPALNITSALDLIKTTAIEAAILDTNLSGEMIFPVADILTKKKIPIVFQTGNAHAEEILALYPSAKLLKKPTDMNVLLSCVADLL